jgi:hypothetical protein
MQTQVERFRMFLRLEWSFTQPAFKAGLLNDRPQKTTRTLRTTARQQTMPESGAEEKVRPGNSRPGVSWPARYWMAVIRTQTSRVGARLIQWRWRPILFIVVSVVSKCQELHYGVVAREGRPARPDRSRSSSAPARLYITHAVSLYFQAVGLPYSLHPRLAAQPLRSTALRLVSRRFTIENRQ